MKSARTYIADGQFAAARNALNRLANESADPEAAFDVRLGPLIHGYSYVVEASQLPKGGAARTQLEKHAESEFVKLCARRHLV